MYHMSEVNREPNYTRTHSIHIMRYIVYNCDCVYEHECERDHDRDRDRDRDVRYSSLYQHFTCISFTFYMFHWCFIKYLILYHPKISVIKKKLYVFIFILFSY